MEEVISRIVDDLERTVALESQREPLISEETLEDLQKLLDNATGQENQVWMDKFSDDLSARKLSIGSIVNPITFSMDSDSVHTSLLATRVYLHLLLTPNMPVFTLFTPMAFLALLRSIRCFLRYRPTPNRDMAASSAAGRKRKQRGKAKSHQFESRNDDDNCSISQSERGALDLRIIFPVLESVELLLGIVHLSRFPDSLKSLIRTVAEIPLIAFDFHRESRFLDKLFGLCFKILSGSLNPDHGDEDVSAGELLQAITPSILHHKSQIRSSALGFVKNQVAAASRFSVGVKKAVVNLPRYWANRAPEKSEARALATESIMDVVGILEYEDQIGFSDYVVQMTEGVSQLRLMAVDLIQVLLVSIKEPVLGNQPNILWRMRCLTALSGRFSDSSATVRSRALSNMAQLAAMGEGARDGHLLKEVLEVVSVDGMNEVLRKRMVDEKAACRRAALLLISKMTSCFGGSFDAGFLRLVGMACSDPLVSVRKAAISALSQAFRASTGTNVITEWLQSVPPLISDGESSIQEECENLFLELVLERISRVGSSLTRLEAEPSPLSSVMSSPPVTGLSLPEGVSVLLKEICSGETRAWVKKICSGLGKKKKLKPKVATALQNIIKASESLWSSRSLAIEKWTAPPGAWFLLSEISAFVSKSVKWEFLYHHWRLLDKHGADRDFRSPSTPKEDEAGVGANPISWAEDRVFLLQTISNVSPDLLPEPAADLAYNLLNRLEDFAMHPTEVNAHVKALAMLCKRKAMNPGECSRLISKWVQQLLSKASGILEKFVSRKSKRDEEMGFFTPTASSGKRKRGGSAAAPPRSALKAVTACSSIGSVVIVCPSANLSSAIPVLHSIITSSCSEISSSKLPVPAIPVRKMTSSLYVQAWLTMGKICLADGKLAKKYIPLFVQELEKTNLEALRNNIIVTMADFCVRYTALVDCYTNKITRCLRDPCELVRRQTFILLSRLLQRDYVKWRGVLFLRFLLSLVDESEKIRKLADYLFGNILKAKAPLLAYNSFVEAVFVLNDSDPGGRHSDAKSEKKLFSISGDDEESRSRRMRIYISLLKQMAPEHLLATFAKLCAEILAAASDGLLDTDGAVGRSVLRDVFGILVCREMRAPPSSRSGAGAEAEEEPGSGGGGRGVAQAVKKSLVQNTIPIFIELKRLLEGKNSPLTGPLMDCLRVILRDYRSEIDEMLVADRQLQTELLYDMRKHDAGDGAVPPPRDTEPRIPVKEVAARGTPPPPLSAISRPKLKTAEGGACTAAGGSRPIEVLRSLQRRPLIFEEEN